MGEDKYQYLFHYSNSVTISRKLIADQKIDADDFDLLFAFDPPKQQNDRSALALLALCNLKPKDDWKDAKQVSMSVVGTKRTQSTKASCTSLHYITKSGMQKILEKLFVSKHYINLFMQILLNIIRRILHCQQTVKTITIASLPQLFK